MAASTETGSLILKVDSTEANKGAEALDKLTVSAEGASKSVDNLAKSEEDAKARIKAMVQASMEKVQAQNASIASGQREVQMTDAQRVALDKLNATSNTQADMNARGASILAAEERTRKAATVTIAEQTGALSKLLGQIDPTIAGYERLDAMQAKLAAFRKSGAISGDDYALFSGKIAAMRAEVDKAGAATHKLTLNSAMARREFGRMGTDIAMGNYGRLSQTSLTLANYTGVMGLAFSATGAAIAGMLAPLGLLLAGYIKGEQEAAAYNKALILTGNIAGETSGQLGNMARNLSGITGSQRDAAAALAAVASTGKFTAAQMQLVTTAALQMQNATGQAVSETIKQFTDLAGDPAAAVAKLNEQQHFLTLSVYDQIKALQDLGRSQDAADLAEKTYADAIAGRTSAIKNNLGTLEKSWNGLKMAASGAWDAMLNVGRADSGQDKFNALAQQKERLEGLIAGGRKFDPNSGRDIQPEIDKVVAAMAAMQDARVAQQKLANNQANAQSAQDAGIALSQQADQYASAEVKRAKQIAKAHGDANDAIAKAQKVQDLDLRAQLIAQARANEQAIVTGIESREKKPKAAKADPFNGLNGLVQKAQVQDNNFGIDGKQTQQVTEILAIVDAGAKLIASGKDVAKVQAEVAVGVEAVNSRYAKQADVLKSQNLVAIAQYQASLDKQNDALQRTITSQIDKIGMGDKEYAQQQKINELYVKSAEALTQLQLKRDGVAAKGGDTSVLDANISALQANTDTQVSIVQRGYREMDAARADWTNGLNSALDDYLDRASDVAGQSAQVFTSAFEGMSNSLANFATTGKGSFKGLVASILSDLAKMELRIAMSKILQQVLGAYIGGATTQTYSGGPSYIGGNGTGGYGMQIQNAKGGVYSSPSLSQYSGQIVNRPTLFAFANGGALGVMGEVPGKSEAIMPLERGSDGKLGVKASGGGGDIIVNTNVTVDSNGNASSDTASSNDSARQLGAMVSNKVKEVMMSESRPGGMLWKMQH